MIDARRPNCQYFGAIDNPEGRALESRCGSKAPPTEGVR